MLILAAKNSAYILYNRAAYHLQSDYKPHSALAPFQFTFAEIAPGKIFFIDKHDEQSFVVEILTDLQQKQLSGFIHVGYLFLGHLQVGIVAENLGLSGKHKIIPHQTFSLYLTALIGQYPFVAAVAVPEIPFPANGTFQFLGQRYIPIPRATV